jgi:hypothetical protein
MLQGRGCTRRRRVGRAIGGKPKAVFEKVRAFGTRLVATVCGLVQGAARMRTAAGSSV